MKFTLIYTSAALCLVLFSSCQTTGNPREGGLFGYSETKAQQRLQDKSDTLDSIESDTARQRRISGGLEGTARSKQRKLDSM